MSGTGSGFRVVWRAAGGEGGVGAVFRGVFASVGGASILVGGREHYAIIL